MILLGVQKVELYWVVYRKHFQIKDWKHSLMQDLKKKPSISLHTACQGWYICFQWKTRLLQHTNSQLETFWTLQVRVLILDDWLYLTTWYIRRIWRKTSDLSQATGKLYHIMLCTSPCSRFELAASVVIGTDCIGICKSNYHTIFFAGQWGMPTVSFASYIAMMAATFTSIIESVGDYYACARISCAPPPPTHAINRGIAIEGFGSIITGFVGSGGAMTSFSENVGAIAFTKVFLTKHLTEIIFTENNIIQIFHVIVVNIQEHFPSIPWIGWICYIARRIRPQSHRIFVILYFNSKIINQN